MISARVLLGFAILLAVYYYLEREIGRRQISESRLIHLNRLYAFLSHANRTIVRAATRDELFREICRVAVEHGQFTMAWIGTPEPESGLIRPVASWGRERRIPPDCPTPFVRRSGCARPQWSCKPSLSMGVEC